MASMKRGVGYCMNKGESIQEQVPGMGLIWKNTGCEDYAKGVFLLNHGDSFYCPRCHQPGVVVKEIGALTAGIAGIAFREVRVEFDYDPIEIRYKAVGIVRDESLWGDYNTYTLKSPLIKTEKRALKVAEAILANLNRLTVLPDEDIPRSSECILSFDDDTEAFKRKLKYLGEDLETMEKLRNAQAPA